MGGQIIDATRVAAPRQRNTDGEKSAIRAGEIPDAWKDKPAKLRQKDRDARWTVKFSKAKPKDDGEPQIDIAIPVFGYKSHVSIDRRHSYAVQPRPEGVAQAFIIGRDFVGRFLRAHSRRQHLLWDSAATTAMAGRSSSSLGKA